LYRVIRRPEKNRPWTNILWYLFSIIRSPMGTMFPETFIPKFSKLSAYYLIKKPWDKIVNWHVINGTFNFKDYGSHNIFSEPVSLGHPIKKTKLNYVGQEQCFIQISVWSISWDRPFKGTVEWDYWIFDCFQVDAHVDLKRKEIKQNWGVKVSYTYRYVKASTEWAIFFGWNKITNFANISH